MKKTIEDVNVQGKKVLVRVDFNVPMDKETGTKITDENRIIGALPTIQYLLSHGAAVILCSHMGKPQGGDSADLPGRQGMMQQCFHGDPPVNPFSSRGAAHIGR